MCCDFRKIVLVPTEKRVARPAKQAPNPARAVAVIDKKFSAVNFGTNAAPPFLPLDHHVIIVKRNSVATPKVIVFLLSAGVARPILRAHPVLPPVSVCSLLRADSRHVAGPVSPLNGAITFGIGRVLFFGWQLQLILKKQQVMLARSQHTPRYHGVPPHRRWCPRCTAKPGTLACTASANGCSSARPGRLRTCGRTSTRETP